MRQSSSSRFCVEVPRASTAPGVDWQLNSTTTDAVSSIGWMAGKAKSVFVSNKIKLVLHDLYANSDRTHEINKQGSIHKQIEENLELWDKWACVEVRSDQGVLCKISNTDDAAKFDAECKNAIKNAEAGRPKKSISLRVEFEEYAETVSRQKAVERGRKDKGPERRRLNREGIDYIKSWTRNMSDAQKQNYRLDFGVDTPFALMYPDGRMFVEHPWDAAACGRY